MMRWIAVLVLALMARGAWAGGWSETFSLQSGSVGLTNSQANSSWVPVSVMWKFTSARAGTAEVWRVSQAESFLLSSYVFKSATTVTWVPDAQYPFGAGEALVIRSSVTNGIVQVIRKAD